MSEPRLTEMQLQEARAAAAPIHLAVLHQSANAPPPIPFSSPLVADADKHSVIGEDLSIEGQSITIRCRGALEVNGKIQAELHSHKLIVGKSGQIEGTIAADNVEVYGRVSGTILGARVVLHPSAEVEGDIHAKTLSVADGASFEGRSRKVVDVATIAPRLDPGAAPPAGAPVPLPRALPAELPAVVG